LKCFSLHILLLSRKFKKCAYKILFGKPEEIDHLEDLGIDSRIVLIFNGVRGCGLDSSRISDGLF
jgi:hypothetical protein